MKKKRYSASDYAHKVFTEDGGVENHESKLKTKGKLQFAATIAIFNIIGIIVSKIENAEIKAKKIKKRDD